MTATFDSHTHAWNSWPYDPPPRSASGEALLGALSENGIARALIVCADIDTSLENNGYVAELVRRNPQKLSYVVDSDCVWSPDHHTTGALSRLQRLINDFPDAAGVTHYVDDDHVDDWFEQRPQQHGSTSSRPLTAYSACQPARSEPQSSTNLPRSTPI